MKTLTLIAAVLLAGPAVAGDTTPQAQLDRFTTEAGAPADAARGAAFFAAKHSGGKPDQPSCSTCHTADPTKAGQALTGKVIEPLAPGANPARFTDTAQVDKWFGRNCNSVLGRECSAQEKADLIAWLITLK